MVDVVPVQIPRCKRNGPLFREFSALRHSGVNVLGSLALGWLATIFLDLPQINSALRLKVTVGFLGAFTTFSTFSYESIQLLLSGELWRALLNVAINATACLGMCYLGMQIARIS